MFGIFIDEAEEMILQQHTPNISKGELSTPMMLYADDIVFLGKTPDELQQLLDIFSNFCMKKRLVVNLGKTQLVVFCGGQEHEQPTTSIMYRGQRLEQVDEYRYLGVTFYWKRGATRVYLSLEAWGN